MKVNTDGVLLPAWVSLPEQLEASSRLRILDIGSGTGVISLIMAQRFSEAKCQNNFDIAAIDIDYNSFLESEYNFENSIWKEQLQAFHISLQDYSIEQRAFNSSTFDLILSNPPFFTNSLNAPSQARNNARHNHSLPLKELLDSCLVLLKENRILAVILPAQEGEVLLELVSKSDWLQVKRVCKVKTLLNKPAKRYMIEIIKSKEDSSIIIEETLVMQEEGGECYTPDYNNLVKDFYLKDFKTKSI